MTPDRHSHGEIRPSAERPLKIAIVVNTFPSLSETFIFNKVKSLAARGHQVRVYAGASSRDAGFYSARLGSLAGVEVVQRIRTSRPWGAVQSAARAIFGAPHNTFALLKRATARYGPRRGLATWIHALPFAAHEFDVVHVEFSGIASRYEDLLALLPAPVIVSCRGTAEQVDPIAQPERRVKLGRVLNAAARVHCVSDDMVATIGRWGVSPGRVFVNRPAIDPAVFTRSSVRPRSDRLRVVSVGRLHWDKGFAYALQAIAEVHRAGVPIEYTVVGSGPDRTHLLYTADCLGLDSVVRFAGPKSSEEVRAIVENADVFLLPTVREGISNACLEAMALETPVVSTTTGGMAEVITHGVNGRLVPPRDSRAIAAELIDLYRSPDERTRLGAAARARIEEHFTLERQVRVFEDEYRRVVR